MKPAFEELTGIVEGDGSEWIKYVQANGERGIADWLLNAVSHILSMAEESITQRERIAELEKEVQQLRTPTDTATVMNHVVTLLQQEGQALYYKVLHTRLVACGIHIRGKVPENALLAQISRDDRFKSLGKGMWEYREPKEGIKSRLSYREQAPSREVRE